MAAPGDKNEGEITNPKAKELGITEDEDYGYYFYPERNGLKKERALWQKIMYKDDIIHRKCKERVQQCMTSNPMVRTLLRALYSHGCPVDMDRHISCEPCRGEVAGGYDPKNMQVVICQNKVPDEEVVCEIVAHELIHGFDTCRAKLDFENIDHLACTEIRAASLVHCHFGEFGAIKGVRFSGQHKFCVMNKAVQSVMLVRNITQDKAMDAVVKVFDKCYNDLEPFGRRVFKNFNRAQRAYDRSRIYYDID